MLIVQKFGGTSVGSPDHIKRIAERIQGSRNQGHGVVVVVSAMNDTTDQFTRLAYEISLSPNRREMDMLLTAGERITMALLSMALHDRGVPAISFTGSQTGIITDTVHGEARIVEVRPIRVGPELDKGKVVIVAGFQGVSAEKEVTTLGRGGSDTTAIALADGLGADACEICTDVPGVMTADPRLVEAARVIPQLPWDLMEEMATQGAGVVHHRAASMATERRVPFRVCSTFGSEPGTTVQGLGGDGPDPCAVTGAVDGDRAWMALVGRDLSREDTVRRVGELLKHADIEPLSWEPRDLSLKVEVPPERLGAGVRALHEVFLTS